MSDLETRLHDALDATPVWRSADDMVRDVRAGARRRQGRRRAGLVATAAVALAVGVVGASDWPRSSEPHVAGAPVTRWSGPDGVSVTNGGVFALTQNVGCAACESVWERSADGSWTRLHDFLPASTPRDPLAEGPVRALRMAPDGRNGWAWGERLWVTHDGGRTWRAQDAADGGPPGLAADVTILVGNDVAWATAFDGKVQSLWRSDVGSDRWTLVPLPEHASALQRADRRHFELLLDAVLPDDRAVITTGSGQDLSTLISTDGGWTPTTFATTQVPSTLFDGAVPVHEVSLTDMTGTTYSDTNWTGEPGAQYGLSALGISAAADGSTVTGDRWLFLHDGHAAVVDWDGAHPVDLPVGGDDVSEVDYQGDDAWLVTEHRALWASHDGGLTWSVQTGPSD